MVRYRAASKVREEIRELRRRIVQLEEDLGAAKKALEKGDE